MLDNMTITIKNSLFVIALFSLLFLQGCLVSIDNIPPQANAGDSQKVVFGEEVQLDGSGSWDGNDDALTYHWSFMRNPGRSQVSLSDPEIVNPVFTPDKRGTYIAQLVVNDGKKDSNRDLVTVEVVGQRDAEPTDFDNLINMGPDQAIKLGERVILNADVAKVEALGGVKYEWHVLNQNANDYILRADQSSAAFMPFVAGNYAIELYASINLNDPDPATGQRVMTAADEMFIRVTDANQDPNDPTMGSISLPTRPPLPAEGHENIQAPCEACHFDDIFLPDGSMPKWHIAASPECGSCHADDAWIPAIRFEHELVIGECVSCHNGEVAMGMPINHLDRDNPRMSFCELCHINSNWLAIPGPFPEPTPYPIPTPVLCMPNPLPTSTPTPILTPTPTPSLGTSNPTSTPIPAPMVTPAPTPCIPMPPPGFPPPEPPLVYPPLPPQSANHLPTTPACYACHSESGRIIRIDHGELFGLCSDCHMDPKMMNSIHEQPVEAECNVCHVTNSWFARRYQNGDGTINYTHDDVFGDCVSCHDGVIATGKSGTHIATTEVCEACHTTTLFFPVTTIDHVEVLGECSQCHDGIMAIGQSQSHETTTEECDQCHKLTNDWTPYITE